MISQRLIEVTTAALTGLFGVAVVVSSIDNGIGWGEKGVDAGTFPLIVGSAIALGSLYNLVRGALVAHEVAVTWVALRRVAGLFLPAAVFIALIPALGMYASSFGYVLATVGWQRKLPPWKTLAIAVAAPLFLYVVFEKLFVVSLPHGALFEMMGF
ncbi:MAG: tripartite tricarboxylate transporter TctB family protein [Proteobacteria bacterium]|nr:tripartite tricarboxylate transporter TctB family protein [Pseudomonadota bacterium]